MLLHITLSNKDFRLKASLVRLSYSLYLALDQTAVKMKQLHSIQSEFMRMFLSLPKFPLPCHPLEFLHSCMFILGVCWDGRKLYCAKEMSWDLSDKHWTGRCGASPMLLFSLSYMCSVKLSLYLCILSGEGDTVVCAHVLPDGWSSFTEWGFLGWLSMKSIFLQPLYPFGGNDELPDTFLRVGKYYILTLGSQIEEYCYHFIAQLLSINAICYSFILKLNLWLGH